MQNCRVLKRYKRFFADIELDGQIQIAHVPNTGSLKGTTDLPCKGQVSRSFNPKRKLAYTLEYLELADGQWIGVNTQRPNRLVEATLRGQLENGELPFDHIRREVAISAGTKFDFCLSHRASGKKRWIEVKNVSMRIGETAAFPDSVTERGRKHLEELIRLKKGGDETELWFVVQRNDCQKFSVARSIDPLYATALLEAERAGVKIRIFAFDRERNRLATERPLPLVWNGDGLDT